MYDVIVTGSEGLLGVPLCTHLEAKGLKVAHLDLSLGHDLSDEEFVSSWFSENPGCGLVNLFALDDSITKTRTAPDLLHVPLEDFKTILSVNVVALFSVCRQFILNNSRGSVVNLASIYGVNSPRPDLYRNGEKNVAYGVSKAAVIQLTKHLGVHAAPNFRFNTIVLGGVAAGQPADFVERYIENVPMKRMATPDEIIGCVEYLLSESSAYSTAGTITIDGGWTAI